MRIRIIDAFTDRPFAGNPAAVCLLDGRHLARRGLDAAGRRGAAPVGDRVRASAARRRRRRRRLGAALVHARGRDQPVRPRDPGHRARHAPRPRHARAPCASSAAAASSSRTRPTTAPSRSTSRPRRPPRCPRPTAWRGARRRPRARPTPPAPSATCWPSSTNEAAVRALAPDFGAVARLARRDGIRGIIATASAPGRRRRLRLRLALLRPRRRHPRGPRHRQRPHGAGAVLVGPPRPRRADRPAGLRPRRPRAHVAPRRPRPPHRPRGRRRSTAR